jgi:predicted transcriptional regulator
VLERKGHIVHRQEGRGFVYRAVAAPQQSQSRVLAQFVKDVFGGSPESLVLNLVEAGNLTLEDLDAIRKKLKKRRAQTK